MALYRARYCSQIGAAAKMREFSAAGPFDAVRHAIGLLNQTPTRSLEVWQMNQLIYAVDQNSKRTGSGHAAAEKMC